MRQKMKIQVGWGGGRRVNLSKPRFLFYPILASVKFKHFSKCEMEAEKVQGILTQATLGHPLVT